jgi:basic membrane lipoprotein Med (substrate-binding protein (PBP1-ABC) superfamily)
MLISRRSALLATGGMAAATAFTGLAGRARAADPIKTAAIYTVPVEQQWVSRIHQAATTAQGRGDIEYTFSEKVANTDYERVMREYCEAGHQLIVGEAFAVEDAARAVAKDYPDRAFLIGSSFKPDGAVPNFAVFDNYIQDASYLSGIVAGAMTKTGNIGMVGGYPIPEVNRLMNAFMAGVRETRADAKFLVAFIGSWFDPPKAKETRSPRSMPAPMSCTRSASAFPTRPRKRACWRSAM